MYNNQGTCPTRKTGLYKNDHPLRITLFPLIKPFLNDTSPTPAPKHHIYPPKVQHPNTTANIMGLFWGKGIGGKHFGTSVHVDRHGMRRGPWRFSMGKYSCFRH
ncbi:hypothetical protein BKA56DRAFT_588943 [Ilyonectria sp. MPI-CAGE-AT-0026]|nr:hypothetical protein BKA56DRAFT_588943 [Ilyonectria sp. MPI-CAGE-AT-0026]